MSKFGFRVSLGSMLVVALLLGMVVGTAQAQQSVSVVASQYSSLGTVLTDGDGNALYLFTADERGVSNCSGQCADFWPPLLTDSEPIAGDGVSAGLLGTIARDASTQVTYNGWPLYYYGPDTQPGDVLGQDVGGVWFVVSIFGGPIQTNASVNLAEHGELGNILVDTSGRSLYLFTPDTRGASNCAGVCAEFWPPLLTIEAPQAGDGVSADALATTVRDDGSTQVTYNGWPLYYFAFDGKPGDANGQDSGDVWYVLSAHGGPIWTTGVVSVTEHTELGNILTDPTGRSLYLFVPDEPNVSNCEDVCPFSGLRSSRSTSRKPEKARGLAS